MFFLHAWSQEMANGLTNQYSLIINSFGFTVLQTTLLGCVTGVANFVSLGIAAWLLAYTRVCIPLPLRVYFLLTEDRIRERGSQRRHMCCRVYLVYFSLVCRMKYNDFVFRLWSKFS